MKYFIKIDGRTIKKNKDAGLTVSDYQGLKSCTFSCINKLPDLLIEGENCFITEYSIDSNNNKIISGVLNGEVTIDFIDECKKNDSVKETKFELELHQESRRIEHFPIPEYSFEYCNVLIKCNNCNNEFYINDLTSDFYFEGGCECCGNSVYNYKVCPRCDGWDCCELEYEEIEDAIKRLKK